MKSRRFWTERTSRLTTPRRCDSAFKHSFAIRTGTALGRKSRSTTKPGVCSGRWPVQPILLLPYRLSLSVCRSSCCGRWRIRWLEKTETGDPLRPDPTHVAIFRVGRPHASEPVQRVQLPQARPGCALRRRPCSCGSPVRGPLLLRSREHLAGVKTIHFARWTFIDDRRRMLFTSNYDGSLENYMDDFIDKIAWSLNAAFSNGVGYPRTRWLIGGGRQRRAGVQEPHPPPPAAVVPLVLGVPRPHGRQHRQNAGVRAGSAEAAPWTARPPTSGCGQL